jgi:hypothetical protein
MPGAAGGGRSFGLYAPPRPLHEAIGSGGGGRGRGHQRKRVERPLRRHSMVVDDEPRRARTFVACRSALLALHLTRLVFRQILGGIERFAENPT